MRPFPSHARSLKRSRQNPLRLFSRLRPALLLGLVGLALFSVFYLPALAQVDSEARFEAKADKLLKEVRRAAERDRAAAGAGRLRNEDSEVLKLDRVAGIKRGPDGREKVGVLVQLSNKSDAELKSAGFAVGSRIGDIATVEVEVERLPELAALSSVREMTAATLYRPLNDRARKAVGIDNSSGQRQVSQTGRGVVVGIIDTGIDFRHLDFTVPGSGGRQTRIKALLDMTQSAGWNYTLPGGSATIGRLYTEADINAALQGTGDVAERDRNGHGTHVAGTAAGNGQAAGSPVYAGMAPEADLVIVKASRQSDGQDNFRDDDMINALKFIQQKASELGEPFVINMSIGGHGGSPHDGTDPSEKAIDNLVNGGPGRVVCVAAGNEGGSGIHASGDVPAGGDLVLNLNAQGSPQSFTLYYANSDRFSFTVTLPDGSTLKAGAFNGQPASNSYLTIYSGLDDKQDTDPSNDQSSLFVVFKNGAESLGSNWKFGLHGDSVMSGGHFDAWVGDGSFAAPYVNESRLVASPGTARGALTVGAYITRSANLTSGDAAYFSSPGPTADGRQKPDISAPGYYLYSSRSGDVAGNFGTIGTGLNAPADSVHYTGLAGTSMATPVVTGSVALLLQANPNLSSGQIKGLVTGNAAHDSFTGSGWTPRFGQGKLNISTAINAAGGGQPTLSNPIDDAQTFVTWHYRDFLNREPDAGGLGYWSSQFTQCGTDPACIHRKRIDISAAFFIELEFQQTGSFVYRLYKGTLNRRPTYTEFTADRSKVIVGSALEQTKDALAQEWVQRPEFKAAYPDAMTSAEFVNKLFDNAGLASHTAERQQQIGALQGGKARWQIIREVLEIKEFKDREYDPSFVLMQYFGYLKRDPDEGGYLFWLNVLNSKEPNNYRGMVCAFLTSAEYQQRFGQTVTRSNRDCAQ